MPYSIPTAWALRFVQNTSLKQRMKPLETSYKFQIGAFATTTIIYTNKVKQCDESIFMLNYL